MNMIITRPILRTPHQKMVDTCVRFASLRHHSIFLSNISITGNRKGNDDLMFSHLALKPVFTSPIGVRFGFGSHNLPSRSATPNQQQVLSSSHKKYRDPTPFFQEHSITPSHQYDRTMRYSKAAASLLSTVFAYGAKSVTADIFY